MAMPSEYVCYKQCYVTLRMNTKDEIYKAWQYMQYCVHTIERTWPT